MTSIFEGQPPKARPFPFKTRVSRVLGVYIYIYHTLILWAGVQLQDFFFPACFPLRESNGNGKPYDLFPSWICKSYRSSHGFL